MADNPTLGRIVYSPDYGPQAAGLKRQDFVSIKNLKPADLALILHIRERRAKVK